MTVRVAKCPSGKLRFLDRFSAVAYAGRVAIGSRLSPYQCRHCGNWHLTSKETKP